MPNAKVLESKKAVVAALVEQLKNAQSGVLVDYSGITVAEDTELRAKLRELVPTFHAPDGQTRSEKVTVG